MSKSAMTIRDWLRIFFRRKLAFLIPVGVGVILGGPLCLVFPPKYRAEALVKRQDLAILSAAPATLIARETLGVSLNTLRVEILTWDSLARVISLLKMDLDLQTGAARENKYNELRRSITLETVAQTRGIDLVKIAAVSDSAEMAQRIANAIADNYVEESKKAGNKPTEDAIRFMGKGAEDALQELHDVEVELDKFLKDHYDRLPEVKKSMLDRRFALHTQQTSKSLQLSSAQSRLIEIEKQMKDVPPRISAPAGERESIAPPAGKTPPATDSAQQMSRLKQSLDTLLANFTEDHPEVKKLRREIAALEEPPSGEAAPYERKMINPAYQQLVLDDLSVRQEIKGCEAAQRQVQAEIGAIDEELRKVVNEESRYTVLLRRQKELETTYSQYRQSQLAAETLHKATTGNYGTQVEMIQRAVLPAAPYRLQRLQIPAVCLLAGLAIGFALVFAIDYTDQSLRTAHEAIALLEVPVLGKISVIPEPIDVRNRRRRMWIAVAGLVTVLVLASLALAFMETIWPEGFERLIALAGRVIK